MDKSIQRSSVAFLLRAEFLGEGRQYDWKTHANRSKRFIGVS